jgi:hypothetical protein
LRARAPNDSEGVVPVDVRAGQLWEFDGGAAPVRRARVVRVSQPISGVRYVFLARVGSGLPMRTTLQRMQLQQGGARLVEDFPAEGREQAQASNNAHVDGDRPQADRETRRTAVHEPKMTAADRRDAVARVQRLHARGVGFAQIAEILCVSPAIVQAWLAPARADGR